MRRSRGPENAYRRAQPAQRHAQLVDVLGVVAGKCACDVRTEVVKTRSDDDQHRLFGRPSALEFEGSRPSWRERFRPKQSIAPFGFAENFRREANLPDQSERQIENCGGAAFQ